jgi:hypothetical protein
MKLMPQDDYYVWDCDWCDSHNRTLWTRIDDGRIVCGVCHSRYSLSHIIAIGNIAGPAPGAMKKGAAPHHLFVL